jgi:hypothetical protein
MPSTHNQPKKLKTLIYPFLKLEFQEQLFLCFSLAADSFFGIVGSYRNSILLGVSLFRDCFIKSGIIQMVLYLGSVSRLRLCASIGE